MSWRKGGRNGIGRIEYLIENRGVKDRMFCSFMAVVVEIFLLKQPFSYNLRRNKPGPIRLLFPLGPNEILQYFTFRTKVSRYFSSFLF